MYIQVFFFPARHDQKPNAQVRAGGVWRTQGATLRS